MGQWGVRADGSHQVTRLRRVAAAFSEANIGAALMAAMLAVMTAQVGSRYVFGQPLSWTEEVLRYLYVWMVFLGASAAWADRGHVAVSFISEACPPRARLWLHTGSDVLLMLYTGLLLVLGVSATLRYHHYPLAVLDWVPYSVVYVVVPLSCVSLLARIALQLRRDWRRHLDGGPQHGAQRVIV